MMHPIDTSDKIFTILSRDNPHPTTELQYTNDFSLLIAVLLSARATDRSVNQVTPSLFKKYDTPATMLALGEAALKKKIGSIGLFHTKAKHIIALCKILLESYEGIIPNHFEFRVSKRLGLAHGNTPTRVEQELLQVVNKKWLQHAHHWLVLHGRWYICRARQPNCLVCSLQMHCTYYRKEIDKHEVPPIHQVLTPP